MQSLLQKTLKKDDDARLVALIDTDTGDSELVIESSIDVNTVVPGSVESIEEKEEAEAIVMGDYLLEDAAEDSLQDVNVRAAYLVFMCVAAISMGAICVSSLPYWFLRRDETHTITLILMLVCLGLYLILYAAAALVRTIKPYVLCVILMSIALFFGTIFIGCFSALIHNMTPIQFLSIVFAQAIAVIIHTHFSRSFIDWPIAAGYMLIATLIVWMLGIYAFVEQRDWIAATVLLVCSIGLIWYNVFQLKAVESRQYNLSDKSRIEAVTRYWLDPFIYLFSICG